MILKWLAVCDVFVMIEYIPFSYFHYISPGMCTVFRMVNDCDHHMRINIIIIAFTNVLYFRRTSVRLHLGYVFTVSYELYANFTHDINFINSYIGCMAIRSYKVSSVLLFVCHYFWNAAILNLRQSPQFRKFKIFTTLLKLSLPAGPQIWQHRCFCLVDGFLIGSYLSATLSITVVYIKNLHRIYISRSARDQTRFHVSHFT